MKLPVPEYLGWVTEFSRNGRHVFCYLYLTPTREGMDFNMALEGNEITVWEYPDSHSEFMTFDESFIEIFEDPYNPTDDELTLLELETGIDVPKEILYTFKRFEDHKNSKELTNDQ